MNLAILFLNIIGTFLVSVEAIKIENLQRLTLLIKKSNSKLNPRIEWIDNSTNQTLKEKLGCYIFLLIILTVFSPISFILLHTLFPTLNTYWLLPFSGFGAFIIWTAIVYFIEHLMKSFTLIETYTSKGFIGIAGFVVLVASFILQYKAAKL
jgi:hypothetical protein